MDRNREAAEVAEDVKFDYMQHKDDPVEEEPGMPVEVGEYSDFECEVDTQTLNACLNG